MMSFGRDLALQLRRKDFACWDALRARNPLRSRRVEPRYQIPRFALVANARMVSRSRDDLQPPQVIRSAR